MRERPHYDLVGFYISMTFISTAVLCTILIGILMIIQRDWPWWSPFAAFFGGGTIAGMPTAIISATLVYDIPLGNKVKQTKLYNKFFKED